MPGGLLLTAPLVDMDPVSGAIPGGGHGNASPSQAVVTSHSSRPGKPHRGCGKAARLPCHLTSRIENQQPIL